MKKTSSLYVTFSFLVKHDDDLTEKQIDEMVEDVKSKISHRKGRKKIVSVDVIDIQKN